MRGDAEGGRVLGDGSSAVPVETASSLVPSGFDLSRVTVYPITQFATLPDGTTICYMGMSATWG